MKGGFVLVLAMVVLALAAIQGGIIVWVCSLFGATDNTKLVLGTQGSVTLILLELLLLAIIGGPPPRITPPRITECDFFGIAGPISDGQLRSCGCERCVSELAQSAFLRSLSERS